MSEADTPEFVPKTMVYITANSKIGSLFCQSNYTLGGDVPLSLTAYLVFERLDEYVEDRIRFKSMLNVCAAASALVDALRETFLEGILSIEGSVERVTERIEVLKEASLYDEEQDTIVVPTS